MNETAVAARLNSSIEALKRERYAMRAVVEAARGVLRHPVTMQIKLREALAALDKETGSERN